MWFCFCFFFSETLVIVKVYGEQQTSCAVLNHFFFLHFFFLFSNWATHSSDCLLINSTVNLSVHQIYGVVLLKYYCFFFCNRSTTSAVSIRVYHCKTTTGETLNLPNMGIVLLRLDTRAMAVAGRAGIASPIYVSVLWLVCVPFSARAHILLYCYHLHLALFTKSTGMKICRHRKMSHTMVTRARAVGKKCLAAGQQQNRAAVSFKEMCLSTQRQRIT